MPRGEIHQDKTLPTDTYQDCEFFDCIIEPSGQDLVMTGCAIERCLIRLGDNCITVTSTTWNLAPHKEAVCRFGETDMTGLLVDSAPFNSAGPLEVKLSAAAPLLVCKSGARVTAFISQIRWELPKVLCGAGRQCLICGKECDIGVPCWWCGNE